MNIELRRFEGNRIPDRPELFRLSFPEHAGTATASEEHYAWKFRDFPAKPPSYEYLAEQKSKILGYYAALPYTYQIDDRNVTAGMVCDVMTHPDARGKGVFTSIGHFATEDLAKHVGFTIGYPIRPEVIPGHIKVGWRSILDLPMYLRPRLSRAFLPKSIKLLSPIVDFLLKQIGQFQNRRITYKDVATMTVRDFLDHPGYEAFVAESAHRGMNTLIKSREFMLWRFSAPLVDYRAVVYTRNGSLGAVGIVRSTVIREIRTLAILDLMALRGEKHGIACVHAAFDQIARLENLEATVVMSAPSATQRLSIRSRFLRSPFTFKLIVKNFDPRIAVQVNDPTRWEPMWIDSDDL